MKKIKTYVLLMLMCFFLASCQSPLGNPASSPSSEPFEAGFDASRSSEPWYMADHLGDNNITILGLQTSKDYPYGYNVGAIEDEVVGSATLITPGTSIIIEETFPDQLFLHFDYILHPWVAEHSDGAVLKISIDGNGNADSYTFDADNYFHSETICLEQYTGGNIRFEFSVQNESGKGIECDWLVLKNVVVDNVQPVSTKQFDAEGYVRSATYFGDEWPINFWNSEMDNLAQDMQQIKGDGFDSIILVIPWREFQPESEPVVYNEYAFNNLKNIMQVAEENELGVYARIGYTWDFYNDKNENIVDRYCKLLGEDAVQDAWFSYVEKMYDTLSSYHCFREGFLTWEDFWNTLGVCDEIFEKTRRDKAGYIGYQEWVEKNYTLSEYNVLYGTNYKSYTSIPVPRRKEPAMAAMYAFYDDFLITLLEESQNYFPNLSMEVRLDWDTIHTADGNTDYYKHVKTFGCGNSYYTATMYGIPMGFENIGEKVNYQEALEKTEYILGQLRLQNGNKPVYVEQFIFADNTPKFKDNAQIKDEDINSYLENVAPVLLENTEGYGIWTYRNYRANMLYNSQFALKGEGWDVDGEVFFEESDGSMTCFLAEEGILAQSVDVIRNHFDSEKYIITFDIIKIEQTGKLDVYLGEKKQTLEATENCSVVLEFPRSSSFDLKIESRGCSLWIDNIRLYSQVQQGFLYDEYNNQLPCASGIRVLNKKLAE